MTNQKRPVEAATSEKELKEQKSDNQKKKQKTQTETKVDVTTFFARKASSRRLTTGITGLCSQVSFSPLPRVH